MKKLGIIVLLFFTCSCLGGYSPNSHFYKLEAISNVKIVSNKKLSIGINDVSLPDYLDKPQLVVFDGNSPKMDISELNRWGEPLDSMIQRTITADISQYLPRAVVKSKTFLNENFEYLVEVQIVRFDMIWNEKAVLEAWWYILDSNGSTLFRSKSLLDKNIGKSFDDFVIAESKLLSDLSMQISEKLADLRK